MTVSYTGQNREAILHYISNNGSLHGYLQDINGRKVTSVSFENVAGQLSFKMHGREFDNPTNALIQLHAELAMPSRGATGSKEGTAGNAASDIIGQYRIFPHIHFGNKTLADIINSQPRTWGGSSKPKKKIAATVIRKALKKRQINVDDRPAREVFFTKFDMSTAKMLRAKFGEALVRREFDLLTQNEFELRFGL